MTTQREKSTPEQAETSQSVEAVPEKKKHHGVTGRFIGKTILRKGAPLALVAIGVGGAYVMNQPNESEPPQVIQPAIESNTGTSSENVNGVTVNERAVEQLPEKPLDLIEQDGLGEMIPQEAIFGAEAVGLLALEKNKDLIDLSTDWIAEQLDDFEAAHWGDIETTEPSERQVEFWRGVSIRRFSDPGETEYHYLVMVNPLIQTSDINDNKYYAAPVLGDENGTIASFRAGEPNGDGSFSFNRGGYLSSHEYMIKDDPETGAFTTAFVQAYDAGYPVDLIDVGDKLLRNRDVVRQSFAFVVSSEQEIESLIQGEDLKLFYDEDRESMFREIVQFENLSNTGN